MNKFKKNKICVVTGSRADYDLLRNLITQLNNSKNIELSVLITGQHLSKKYGKTSVQALRDFGKICKSINIEVDKTNSLSIIIL